MRTIEREDESMDLLGFGDWFVLFFGPMIAPVLVLIWFCRTRNGHPQENGKG